MNAFGVLFAWAAVQTTLLCTVTAAVYVMVRRRNPSAAARVAIVGVALSALLTVGIVSPWPRWSIEGGVENESLAVELPDVPIARDSGMESPRADSVVAAAPETDQRVAGVSDLPGLATLWRRAASGLSGNGSETGFLGVRWTVWLAAVALLSMAIGAVRLLAGSLSVRNCVRRSRPVADREVEEAVAALAATLGCRVPVAVRESNDVGCAATVGFRKPLILLPPEWRTWSESERRAVLAHELAHVAAGDAATWLAAQCGLMLHFYHPLMHWLAQRLRLEQELSADAAAAPLAGGSRSYLTTLAALAVRHSARPVPWPVRAFLPAPGTLLRRIDMLRNGDGSTVRASRWRTGLAVLLVIGCAALVAGFRPEPQQTAAMGPVAIAIDWSSAIFGAAENTTAALKEQSRDNLKQIALAFHNSHAINNRFPPAVLLGPDGKTTYSWRVAILPLIGEETLFAEYDRNQPWDSEHNRKVLAKMPAILRHPADKADSTNAGYFLIAGEHTAAGATQGAGTTFKDFIDGTSNTLLVVEAKREIPWTQPDDLPYSAKAAVPELGGWFDDGFFTALGDGSVHFLAKGIDEPKLRAVITRDGMEDYELVRAALDSASRPTAKPATSKPSNPAGEKDDSFTKLNLKKLGLAFHGYHDLFLTFPPPVSYGPDGKTPHSWRVEILPVLKYYVEQEKPDPFGNGPVSREKYNELIAGCGYDVTQPWDSEQNKKVLAAMPDVYLNPHDSRGSSNASFFVLTGDKTAVGNTSGKGTPITQIHDGLSNTLLLVEAKRGIPWTKPEDIEYRADADVPALGGWVADRFHVELADGSVRVFKSPADAEALRIVVTRDGGEVATEAIEKLELK